MAPLFLHAPTAAPVAMPSRKWHLCCEKLQKNGDFCGVYENFSYLCSRKPKVNALWLHKCRPGGEMADALVSGTSGVTSVSVRLRSRAQKSKRLHSLNKSRSLLLRHTRKIGAADFFKQMCYHNRVSNGVLVFCVNAREGEIREKC